MSKKDFQNGFIVGLTNYLMTGKELVVNPANTPLIKVKGQFENSSYFYENLMPEDFVETSYLHPIDKVATVDLKVPFSMRSDGEIALAMRFFDADGYHLDTVQATTTFEGSGEFHTNDFDNGVLPLYLNQLLRDEVTLPEGAEYFDLVLFTSSSSIVIDAELINLVYDK